MATSSTRRVDEEKGARSQEDISLRGLVEELRNIETALREGQAPPQDCEVQFLLEQVSKFETAGRDTLISIQVTPWWLWERVKVVAKPVAKVGKKAFSATSSLFTPWTNRLVDMMDSDDPRMDEADLCDSCEEIGVSMAGGAARIAADCCERLMTPSGWNLIVAEDGSASCCVCQECFKGGKLHHCRNCGDWVCDADSQMKSTIPWKGWHDPVRICDSCKDDVNLRLEALALKQQIECQRSFDSQLTDELERAVFVVSLGPQTGNDKVEVNRDPRFRRPSKAKSLDPTICEKQACEKADGDWSIVGDEETTCKEVRRIHPHQATQTHERVHPWCKSVQKGCSTNRFISSRRHI
jgi:hypothetical protein